MFFLGKKNEEIFTDINKYVLWGTYFVKTVCEKATFPKGIHLLDGIGLKVFVKITVENSLK